MVIVEKLVEWRLAGETEVLGENLPQRHFVHHKSPGLIPDRRGGKPATNRLSYGAALVTFFSRHVMQMSKIVIKAMRSIDYIIWATQQARLSRITGAVALGKYAIQLTSHSIPLVTNCWHVQRWCPPSPDAAQFTVAEHGRWSLSLSFSLSIHLWVHDNKIWTPSLPSRWQRTVPRGTIPFIASWVQPTFCVSF
jgi:hypothetical protein